MQFEIQMREDGKCEMSLTVVWNTRIQIGHSAVQVDRVDRFLSCRLSFTGRECFSPARMPVFNVVEITELVVRVGDVLVFMQDKFRLSSASGTPVLFPFRCKYLTGFRASACVPGE